MGSLPSTLVSPSPSPYGAAIIESKAEGKCPPHTVHRQVKYLNNIIEADHGKLKRLINPVRGFKSMKTAYATLKGFELMRMFSQIKGRILVCPFFAIEPVTGFTRDYLTVEAAQYPTVTDDLSPTQS